MIAYLLYNYIYFKFHKFFHCFMLFNSRSLKLIFKTFKYVIKFILILKIEFNINQSNKDNLVINFD